MEEITIKNFIKRTPHIKTMHDVHLYAVYVYANVVGVYCANDPTKRLIPFSTSDEELRTRAMLIDEALNLCKLKNKNYTSEMGEAVYRFQHMNIEDKRRVLDEIF